MKVAEGDPVGTRGAWRLKNARFSISIIPLKARPSENAASAPATTGVWSGVELAALVEEPDDGFGRDREGDACRERAGRRSGAVRPPTMSRKPSSVFPRGQPRERREEHGGNGNGEHALREHVDTEGLVDRGRGDLGSMSRAAKKVPISELKLMRPRPSITGTVSAKTCLTAGSRTQLIIAGLAGFIVGQTLNAWVVVRIKARTKEKHLWARLIGSTIVGEFADTVVFCAIAAGAIGISTWGDFLTYVALGWVYKTAVEIVVLPVTYRVIAYIKRREPTYQPAV